MIRGLAIAFVWGQVGLWCACAGSGESAHLVASVLPGPLELVSPAVVVLEEEFDVGAVREFRFVIKDVIVNDLDGDGRGWELRAYPSAMEGENGGVFFYSDDRGFVNPNVPEHTAIPSPDRLVYESGDGVSGFSVDYGISYEIPALAYAGRYTGQVRFEIKAD